MARPLRIEFPGAVYHVTARGNEKRDIYRDDRDRESFLDFLKECVRRFDWIIHAYVLMSNHFHFLVELQRTTLSRGLHWLDGGYTSYFNRRHNRVGHLFQGRPDAPIIDKENYFLEVLRYIVLNPVRAQMVALPEDYEWSSYRGTAGLAPPPEWLTVDDALGHFSPDRDVATKMYRDFVYAGIGLPSAPWDNLVGQIFLGTPAWLEDMRRRVEEKPREHEHPRAQRYIGKPTMVEVVDSISTALKIDPQKIRDGRGGVPRMLAAWLGCYEGQHSLSAIAAGLRLRNAGHVSVLIRQCDERLQVDTALQGVRDRCVFTLRSVEKTSEP